MKLSRSRVPSKPYNFCCDEKDQHPEKCYDMRHPPFASSLTDVILGSGGPGVKFRVKNFGPLPFPVVQRRIFEVKGESYLEGCKRCRNPLQWYLEDEIALAREFLAKEKQDNYNTSAKKNLMIAKRKGNTCKIRSESIEFQFLSRFGEPYVLIILFYIIYCLPILNKKKKMKICYLSLY